MSLQLLSTSPANNAIDTTIDSKIEIGFNAEIDPFTIPFGISVYSIGPSTMTGPLMAELDVHSSDVNTPFDNISILDYSYEVSGSNVILTPITPFKSQTKYYVQVVPGNDINRFLSLKTFSDVVYSRSDSNDDGEVNITSSFTGSTGCTYLLSMGASGTFDLSKDRMYVDSYTFVDGVEFTLDKKINISINGAFSIDDTAEFHVYPASGVEAIYKISFLTTSYKTAIVKSTRIEDKLYKRLVADLKVISIIPSPLSINNERCNPVIIKFSKNLNTAQDFTDLVKVFKADIETGLTRKVTSYCSVNNDTLKIYLVSVEPTSEMAIDSSLVDLQTIGSTTVNMSSQIISTDFGTV